MTESRFVMVSEWMAHGNINKFIETHPDANRFELVSFSFRLPMSPTVVDTITVTLIVGRCRERLAAYALPENDSWGPQRSMFPRALIIHSLTDFFRIG